VTPDKTQLDFVCIGSATQDVFVRSDGARILTLAGVRDERRLLCFDYGAKVDVEHIEFTTGGGATNAAVSLARLGARSAFLGKIGPDEIGQLVLKELAEHGVDASLHLRSEDESTGYSVILTSYEGDRTVLTHRGASTTMDPAEVDWSFIDRTGWLYVSSLSGDSAALLGPLAEKASSADVKIAFNPGSTQIGAGLDALRPFLEATEVLVLNRQEAARLTGKPPLKDPIDESKCTLCGRCIEVCPTDVFYAEKKRVTASAIERCVRCGKCVEVCEPRAIVMEPWAFNVSESFEVLCAAGPKIVVITDGARGCQASDGEELLLLPATEVPVASSLGAGDAFGSAFAFEYAGSGDVGRALALGSANAASVVQVVGAKNGLLDAAGAKQALDDYDEGTLRRHRLADVLAAARS